MRKKFINLFALSLLATATFSGGVNASLKEDLNKKNNAETTAFNKCMNLYNQAQFIVTGAQRLMVAKDNAVWKFEKNDYPKDLCLYEKVGTLNANYTFDICNENFKLIWTFNCNLHRKEFKKTTYTSYFEIDGGKLVQYLQNKVLQIVF